MIIHDLTLVIPQFHTLSSRIVRSLHNYQNVWVKIFKLRKFVKCPWRLCLQNTNIQLSIHSVEVEMYVVSTELLFLFKTLRDRKIFLFFSRFITYIYKWFRSPLRLPKGPKKALFLPTILSSMYLINFATSSFFFGKAGWLFCLLRRKG